MRDIGDLPGANMSLHAINDSRLELSYYPAPGTVISPIYEQPASLSFPQAFPHFHIQALICALPRRSAKDVLIVWIVHTLFYFMLAGQGLALILLDFNLGGMDTSCETACFKRSLRHRRHYHSTSSVTLALWSHTLIVSRRSLLYLQIRST